MEFMRIGKMFGPAVGSLINKVVKNKCGVSPEIEIDEITVANLTDIERKEERVEVVFRATMSESGLQALLKEVTK